MERQGICDFGARFWSTSPGMGWSLFWVIRCQSSKCKYVLCRRRGCIEMHLRWKLISVGETRFAESWPFLEDGELNPISWIRETSVMLGAYVGHWVWLEIGDSMHVGWAFKGHFSYPSKYEGVSMFKWSSFHVKIFSSSWVSILHGTCIGHKGLGGKVETSLLKLGILRWCSLLKLSKKWDCTWIMLR